MTLAEVVIALAIGGLAGLVAGLALGANPFLSGAFERYLYYLGPTPKIVFFPIMIMWFGVGPESKVAMGTVSAFFPIALSVAAGNALEIDRVLIRVGRSLPAEPRLADGGTNRPRSICPRRARADHQRRPSARHGASL